MKKAKREALERAGWVVGDAEDFLELTDAERELVALRVAISRTVREIRTRRGLTQAEAARLLGLTQPLVSNLENAGVGLSLDLMVRSLIALGGSIHVSEAEDSRTAGAIPS